MSPRYSALTILREGLSGHKGWTQAWRKAHGLATAYYLAKNHGRTRVAVIEKGWLGGGNTGRNTTIVRSNYFYPESVALYDLALRLYEGLSRELNFNVMLSQRGILNISHTPAQLEIAARLVNAMQLNGVDAELWGPDEIRRRLPLMTQSLDSRYLPNGGVWQRRGGTARHDAVAWGFARAADRLGVDIVENCEVTGFIMQNGACAGVETTQGEIRAEAVGVAVAGHCRKSWPRRASGCRSTPTPCRLLSASRSSRASTSSFSIWGRASMRASRTRARSCSAAVSTAFPPTVSAEIRRCRRSSFPA